jgi:deoxyribodipyrimidine photo-lyase
VFNPTSQSRRFDADGTYIRRWVSELRSLDDATIHEPATAGPLALAAAGVELGVDYPLPIVDHDDARRRALDAYAAVSGTPTSGPRTRR